MNLVLFSVLTFFGSAVYNTVLCSLGYLAGNAWQEVSAQANNVSDIVLYLIIALVIVGCIAWVIKRIIMPRMQQPKHEN